jgi:predicted outer membrane protein
MAHANPIQIQKYLKGVDYPASREQLIENARKLGADDNICASLEQLPDEEFQTPADVSQAFKGPSTDQVQDDSAEAAPSPPAAPQHEPGAREFLIQVMEDSLAEIELCFVALDNTKSDDIKAFAQTMIDEHGQLGQQIEQIAKSMKIPFPKKMRAEHDSLIRDMSKLMGEEFDRRFMEQNLQYHENDLKVFQHYAQEEGEGPAKELADAGVKLFGKHLKMVKELARKHK